jgi:spectinomycin phosphotransferase
MLEKPDLPDGKIMECLRRAYGLNSVQLVFLPLGADRNTAVYRAVTDDGTVYFVKLRGGDINTISVVVPQLLYEAGVTQIISPIATQPRQLWAGLDDFAVILYPFVDGQDAYAVDLTEAHWIEFGQALKGIHSARLPPGITDRIPQENWSAHWRKRVKEFQRQVETTHFADPVSAELAALLRKQSGVINHLVTRAEHLADVLKTQSLEYVVCHADIHAGNLLIGMDGGLHIVDWDTLVRAPKERDLMYVGGGLFANQRSAGEEERLFYQGYGQTAINRDALAYYRSERIVQDIAAYCEQILLTEPGGEDRANGLQQLTSQFEPGAEIDSCCQS